MLSETRLKIKMLGELSFTMGDKSISDSTGRANKVWLLLAYLFYNRKREITQNELVKLLWSGEEELESPSNTLKTMFHRVRRLFDELEDGLGNNLFFRKKGNVVFNSDIQCDVDCEKFEKLYNEGKNCQDKGKKLDFFTSAVDIYGVNGDFLPKQSNELWVISLSTYYHSIYVQVIKEMVAMLLEKQDYAKMADICAKAVKIEPYEKEFYYDYMNSLIKTGRSKDAADVYNDMSRRVFDEFGILPPEKIRALYREATSTINICEMNVSEILDQLRETGSVSGAYFCEYDFFKILYQSQARALERNGDVVQVCLLSIVSSDGGELSKRSLNTCLDNLDELIRASLRRSDVVSKCSLSQYIVMLPHANYEDGNMVIDRIVKKFKRQYPHSPADLQYSIQPIKPVS